MDDAAFMRGRDSVDERHGDVEQSFQRNAFRYHHGGQRFALDELHRQKVQPVVLLDGKDRDDVRMIEGCNGLSLALETLQSFRVGCRGLGKSLQCHAAMKFRVESEIDLAHPAGAEQLEDAIGTDCGPDQWGGSRWRMFEELSRVDVRLEKRFHFGAKRVVCAADLRQKVGALTHGTIER